MPEREEVLLYILDDLLKDRLGSVKEKDIHKKVHEFISGSESPPINYKFITGGSGYPFSYELSLDINRLVARSFLKVGPMEFIGDSVAHSYEFTESGRAFAERMKSKGLP